jgi:hypothetical protein
MPFKDCDSKIDKMGKNISLLLRFEPWPIKDETAQ